MITTTTIIVATAAVDIRSLTWVSGVVNAQDRISLCKSFEPKVFQTALR